MSIYCPLVLCRVVNAGSPLFPKNFQTALQSFDVNADGLIDYYEFLDMEKRFPLILYPAFRLQDRMQKISLGMWRRREGGGLRFLIDICNTYCVISVMYHVHIDTNLSYD